MEKLRSLKRLVIIIAVLLGVELGMLLIMLRPLSFYVWFTVAAIAVLCIYLISLSLKLIAELKNKNQP